MKDNPYLKLKHFNEKKVAIKPLENFMLEVKFENDCTKLFDFKNYLQLPIFKELNDFNKFYAVKNKFYFIEWESYELDLSADTLWHEGKIVPTENFSIV